MKNIRMFSIVMAVIILVTAIVPFAVSPAAALQSSGPMMRLPDGEGDYEPAIVPPDGKKATSSAYSCSLVTQNPPDWITMQPRQSFDVSWTVQNNGAKWYANYTQFAYVWGAKMQTKGDIFGIANDVGTGRKLHLTLDMEAPKTPGTYPITWGLYSGYTRICVVTLIVTVVR